MTELRLHPRQIDQVSALADRTAACLETWAEDHPSVRRARIGPIAQQLAASAPFAPVEALTSTLQIGLWIAALDDLLDEGQAPQSEVADRLGIFADVAHLPERSDREDDLARMLFETYNILLQQPLFPALEALWLQALNDHLQGHLAEHAWRSSYRQDRAALPSYEDYLAVGRHTIGFPLIPWTFLLLLGDPSTPQHAAELNDMASDAGICLRLANDLRSYERELKEEKINAVVILSRDFLPQGEDPSATLWLIEERMRTEIAAGLAKLRQRRQTISTQSGQPEAAILGMAETGCAFYHRRDFHVAA